MTQRFVFIRAKSIEDATGPLGDAIVLAFDEKARPRACPAATLCGDLTVVAVGPWNAITQDSAMQAEMRAGRVLEMDRRDAVLLPGLVNAHTHLDLTHVGPRACDSAKGFQGFVDLVRAERRVDGPGIRASVERGIELSLRGGVVAVGDIAGAVMGRASTCAVEPLLDGPMRGVSFVEFFAIGAKREESVRALHAVVEGLGEEDRLNGRGSGKRAVWGLSPHATNTVEPWAFDEAMAIARERGLRVATHIAETPEERDFVARAAGPQREFLERLGLWEPRLDGVFGQGRSPVAHLSDRLTDIGGSAIAVHVNQASDEDIAVLSRAGTTVAYCPRASEYFGAARAFGPHRYREMVAGGAERPRVRVVLGTDSIINLDTPDRISTLDDARRLFRRDGFDARRLLEMISTEGAEALGLSRRAFEFFPGGRLAGLVAVPIDRDVDSSASSLEAALLSTSAPELLGLGV